MQNNLQRTYRINYLTIALKELNKALNEGKSINFVIESYKNELETLKQQQQVTTLADQKLKETPPATAKPHFDFANWYAENNILFLLYLGTLLIVLSAATFVAFNWEQFSGVAKTLMLIFVTLAFLSSGFALYFKSARLKVAGITFSTIGALLIPFNGVAYYNFVQQGGKIGPTWFITSALSVVVYLFMTRTFKGNLFKYISALATLSFVESFVNLGQFGATYYILGGILTSYVLLLLSRYYREEPSEEGGFTPFDLSAQIILPTSLAFGLIYSTTHQTFFEPLTYLAILLATVFYALVYYIQKKEFAAYVAVLLAFIFAGNFTYTTWSDAVFTLYSVFLGGIIIIAMGTQLKTLGKNELAQQLIQASVIAMIPTYAFAAVLREGHSSGVDMVDTLIFSIIVTGSGLASYIITKSKLEIVISHIFALIALNLFFLEIYTGSYGLGLFSLGVLAIGVANYWIGPKDLGENISTVFTVLAVLLSFNDLEFAVIISLATAAFYFYRAVEENNKLFSLTPSFFVMLAAAQFMSVLEINENYIPLGLSITAVVLALPEVLGLWKESGYVNT